MRITCVGLAILSCKHTEPFGTADYQSVGPLVPGNPTRLTYNIGFDLRASWLPDGSAFLFSEEQVGRRDQDQCLALMPRSGGATTRLICAASDAAGDTANLFFSAAVGTNGALAYVRTSTLANVARPVPDYASIVLATYATPQPGTQIVRLPYFSPDSQTVDVASDLHWTDPSTLYYLADHYSISCTNIGCGAADSSLVGFEIDRVALTSAGPSITLVPGTVGAAALATAGSDTVYFALSNSGAVHRRIVSTSVDTVIISFTGVVTGLSASAGRLAAAVDGTLHVVTLSSGTDAVLPPAGFGLFADHPALDPTGHLLVADVTGLTPADLWLWTVP